MLLGADGAAVDPAVAAGQGAAVRIPDGYAGTSRRWIARRGSALEGRVGIVDHAGWHRTSLTSSGPCCRRMIWSESRWSARSRSRKSLGCSRGRWSRSSTRRRCSAPPPPRTRRGLVRHGVRRLLDAVTLVDEQPVIGSMRAWSPAIGGRATSPIAGGARRPSASGMLTRVAEDAERALWAVEAAEGMLVRGRSRRRTGC